MQEPEHKHPHPHHHHRHHHGHHHDHSGTSGSMQGDDEEFPIFDSPHQPYVRQGDSPYTVNQGDNITNEGDTRNETHIHSSLRGIGVKEAIMHIIEAVGALPTRYERKLALGHAMGRLVEQDRITSVGDVLQVAMSEINRYAHVGDDIAYTPQTGRNQYR